MLPNEIFALACRERYAEDGLVVDESNGEFAHCPLPKGLGETGYYLLHDDHQWQGLLQSKDVGRRCYWIGHAKRWLETSNFVDGYFDLWDIFDEFNQLSEEHRRKIGEAGKGRIPTEETRRRMSEAQKGVLPSKETRRKMSEARTGGVVKLIIATKPCGTELSYEGVREAQRKLETTNLLKYIKTSKIVTRGKFKGWQFRYA